MDDIKEKIKQALRHIWTNKYRLFLCLLTLCCLFGLVHYFKSADSATASISFNYSEASLGLNPNKTRFNAYEIVSDEVMERAIRRVGLQDSLTASQLAECLYLSPDGTGSANGSEYISTNYYLSINTRKLNLGNRKPTDLLQSVCESYREIFLSNYCDNQSILKEKLEVTTACEPYLRLNELEVRAAALAKLAVAPTDTLWDVGAGTGSVSVEMALAAPMGQVYAVECDADACALVRQNQAKFAASNLTLIAGKAPEALQNLPAPDAVFIGGSKGNMQAIVDAALAANPQTRLCIAAIALETLQQSIAALAAHGLAAQVTQIAVSRSKAAGSLHLMMANNPVFLIVRE